MANSITKNRVGLKSTPIHEPIQVMKAGHLMLNSKSLTLVLAFICAVSLWVWVFVCLFREKPETILQAYFWGIYAFFASPVLALPVMALIFRFRPAVRKPLVLMFASVTASAYWIVAPQQSIPKYELGIIIFPTVLWILGAIMTSAAVITSHLIDRSSTNIWPGIAIIAISIIASISLLVIASLTWPMGWWVILYGSFGILLVSLIACGLPANRSSQPSQSSDTQKTHS